MNPYQDRSHSEEQETADVQNIIQPDPMEVGVITPQEWRRLWLNVLKRHRTIITLASNNQTADARMVHVDQPTEDSASETQD